MRTSIYNKMKRLVALLFVGGVMMTNVMAQESLHLFYKDGTHVKHNTSEDMRIVFEKRAYIRETAYTSLSNDTIFLSPSAGDAYIYGFVESNYPWIMESDADWMMAYTTVADSMREAYGYTNYDNQIMVFGLPNTSNNSRAATLTLKTANGKAVKRFTVLQQPYTLSFSDYEYYNDGRFNGKPVTTDTLNLDWDATSSIIYIMPNHGVKVVSYPDWMTLDTIVYPGDGYSLEWQKEHTNTLPSYSTGVYLSHAINEKSTPRSGSVVFEANGQKATVLVVQEGLNETSILKSAEALHQMLYEFDVANTTGHNDFGFPALMLFTDSRGMDMVSMNHGYNWFSAAVDYSDIIPNYRPTAIYWRTLYNNIKAINRVIKNYGARESESLFRAYLAQAYALRAFDYFYLAQMYSHTYVSNGDSLCVPIITEENMGEEYAIGIPRATVSEVYDYIMMNLDKAIALLQQNTVTYPHKGFMSVEAAYGLRARINLVMNRWEQAFEDANRVLNSGVATPYTIEQVSKPTFVEISDAAWLWGINTEETDRVVTTGIINWPSHLCSMTGNGYTTGVGLSVVHKRINQALWEQIPSTDVRKGWWVDGNMWSPLLVNAYGEDLANTIPQSVYFAPYTNVKFGTKDGELFNTNNAQDVPLMRIEEMIFIAVEAKAMMGDVATGTQMLNSFVQQYRDPAYNCTVTTARELQKAVWMQRRIELWGEGHSYYDLMRMKRPVDRRGAGFEPHYVFNVPDGDAARIYPIPQLEMNNNPALVQNTIAEIPQPIADVVPAASVAEVLAAGAGVEASIEGTVVATYARGFLVDDGTGHILVYLGRDLGYVVGDVVLVSGTVTSYAGLLQFPNTSVVKKMGTTSVSYPEPTIMDATAMDAYLTTPSIQYVQYSGTLNISGNYYNVNIDGTTTAIGSISYPNEGVVNDSLNGKEITITGYLIGVSSGKYVNTMALNVEVVQEPVHLNEVSYSSYNNDTIFMSASAGRTYSYGLVQCSHPWKVTADADWLMTKVNEDTIYNSSFTSGLPYENLFMVYATANETDQERVGHVTISTEQNVSKTFTVVQRPYTLSFHESAYINNIRYDGEPVDTFVINGTWDWRNIYYNLLPNHGWEVTSYPDWMAMNEFAHGAENCSFDAIRDTKNLFDAGQPVASTASFTFEPNESPEPRTAHIIFEGHGQKAVGIFHQEGLNEQAILNSAETLAKKMYQFGEAVGTNHHNDFGFPSLMLTMDGRGTDLVSDNSGYNWFSNSLDYKDLGSNLVYTAMYWTSMYNQIQAANEVIRAYGDRSEQSLFQFYLGQAYAFRAFNYFYLAQLYQQTYVGNEDQPCVPIISESNMETVYTEGCARATVREVYDFILSDLDKSLDMLQQTMLARPGKQFVSSEVIYGLRARINMVRGEWQAAAADAQRVIESGVASPYTLDEVSKPTFNDINHNAWLWGIDVTENDSPVLSGICNWPSHMGSLNYGYAQVGAWRKVSQSLYNAIPSSDVRKGWFLDANATSVNLNAEQVDYVVANGMPAYTQVKFAPYNDVLSNSTNASDIPLMRIEEMHLILAEAQAMLGNTAEAAKTLNNFVATYRDLNYNCTATTAEELLDAVWMQRRIELWGEGHSYFDLMRLKKGVDRRGAGFQPDYVYNIPAGDAALIYPIPDREMSRNFNLIQNPVAEQPKSVMAIELEDAFEHYCYGTLAVGLFVGQWEQAMEVYQLDENIYRLPDYIAEGYDLVFHWDQTTNEAMFLKNSWETGYMHSTYGMITANGRSIVYDEATKTFTFTVEYTVSAGSFGVYNDTFTLPGGGEEPSSALYMIGQDFGAWDWTSDGVVTMTPVNSHEGAFWTTRYFTAGNGFKFCQKREWNGDFFSLGNDSGYTMSGGNCVVEKDGFYTVYVDLNNSIIAVEPAAIYGIGECFGGWDVHNAKNLFAAQEQTLVSPSFVLDGEIRMYAAAPSAINEYYSVEWWQMEFNIYDGVIVYRGADGDQERVPGYLGQQVTLDLNAGTGAITNAANSSTKISDVLAAGEGTEATIQGTILATYARGFLVADDTGSILIYLGSGHGYVAGDIVSVSGTVNLYGGLLQFPNTSIVEKMGHTEISYSEPTIMDAAAMDAYLAAPGIQYAQYTGTLNINGNYYNVNIEGATTAVGSISYPNEGLVDANFNGKAVTVTGYLIGASSNKYVNTMAVNVTLAEGNEEEPEVPSGIYYSNTLLGNDGGFTVYDVTLGTLAYVWQNTSNYGWKASGYYGGAVDSESWLVSPAIDLTAAKAPILTVDQALNYLKSANRADNVQIYIATDFAGDPATATWQELSLDAWPEGANWDFITSTADLSAYVGKSIHLAFKYTSTKESATTWEFKNLNVVEK